SPLPRLRGRVGEGEATRSESAAFPSRPPQAGEGDADAVYDERGPNPSMSNPILVEVTRGTTVESRHRGSVAVVDADGATVLSLGDVKTPIFPRSAIKGLQALVLVESGGADRYGLDDEALALACASHSGEPAHVARAERTLRAAGLDASALECGTHWPSHQASALALARSGATAT